MTMKENEQAGTETSVDQTSSESWGGEDRKRFSELTHGEQYGLSMRWFYALEAFKEGTDSYLTNLLRGGWPIPPKHYEDLAKIVEAHPKPKGAGKLKLDFIQRQYVWSELEKISDLRKAIMLPGMLEVTAQMNNQEPSDVLAYFKEIRRLKINELAELYGVSTHTIVTAFKDYPNRMES